LDGGEGGEAGKGTRVKILTLPVSGKKPASWYRENKKNTERTKGAKKESKVRKKKGRLPDGGREKEKNVKLPKYEKGWIRVKRKQNS